MKYKLGEKHPTENLYRIVALKDFANIKEGTVGGWVKGEHNLTQEGNCWVYGDAQVYGNAWVSGNVQVSGNARVYGYAQVYGDVWVHGDVWMYGDAWVYGGVSLKREWVGLTDEEILAELPVKTSRPATSFARAIEAKLKEKNT